MTVVHATTETGAMASRPAPDLGWIAAGRRRAVASVSGHDADSLPAGDSNRGSTYRGVSASAKGVRQSQLVRTGSGW